MSRRLLRLSRDKWRWIVCVPLSFSVAVGLRMLPHNFIRSESYNDFMNYFANFNLRLPQPSEKSIFKFWWAVSLRGCCWFNELHSVRQRQTLHPQSGGNVNFPSGQLSTSFASSSHSFWASMLAASIFSRKYCWTDWIQAEERAIQIGFHLKKERAKEGKRITKQDALLICWIIFYVRLGLKCLRANDGK